MGRSHGFAERSARTSVGGFVVQPMAAVYAATKFAVRAISEGFRKESTTVRSTCIYPGVVTSELANMISDPTARERTAGYRKIAIAPDAIGSSEVLSVLEPIWLTIPDTARRILQRIGAVLDFAHIKGMVPAEVSLRSVTRGLPRQGQQVTHRAAMPYADVPAFWAALRKQPNSVGRDALKLTILTAVRSGETRFATWREFDLDGAVWSIPAKRMKMKQPHVVPLSPAAAALLRRIRSEHAKLTAGALDDQLLFYRQWPETDQRCDHAEGHPRHEGGDHHRSRVEQLDVVQQTAF